MPESSILSTLTEPEDSEVLRCVFLMCLSEYQLLDEQLISSAKKLLAAINEQGVFNSSMFDHCTEASANATTPNASAKRFMYLALHHPSSWLALLNAEADPILKESSVYKIICTKGTTISITRGFKQQVTHILVRYILLDLIDKISPSTNPVEISGYLTAIGIKTAEDLFLEIVLAPLPECSRTLFGAITQEGFEAGPLTESGIHLYAHRLLNAFEQDVMVNRLTVLCRFGMVHALDALQKLFVSFSLLFQKTKTLKTTEEKIKNQIATLIVFSLFYKALNAEALFGSRAEFYQQDFYGVIILRSAVSYQKEGPPKNTELYSQLFEPIIQRMAPGITKEHIKPCQQAIDTLLNPERPIYSLYS